MEKCVNIYSRQGGWEESCSETCNMGMSTRVDEDIGLEERERATNV